MIVDSHSLDIRPISDELLKAVNGSYYPEYLKPGICWSNELALHVIELKTCMPFPEPADCTELFLADVNRINEILDGMNARLMPGGAHPWMDPFKETRLWPHHYNKIYEAYNKIFDCRGHGWSNLQSCHINLPFNGDVEFAKLHAAIRVLLPIMPALAASTPIVDAEIQKCLDHRMEVYRTNSKRIPSVTAAVIPEPVFTKNDYEREIFQKMYTDIAPYDPEKILQDEWLNARGAIARFDRSAIEIRVLDVQECPAADLAVAALIINALKFLIQDGANLLKMQAWQTAPLAEILFATTRDAEKTMIFNQDYLALFGMRSSQNVTAGDLWQHIYHITSATTPFPPSLAQHLSVILNQGTLASRIINRLNGAISQESLTKIYGELCDCLRKGKMFQ